MKYRKLPLYAHLERIAVEQGNEAMETARGQLAVELFKTEGFQFLTQLLRDLETRALRHLRRGSAGADRQLGRLECIEEIRLSLEALLPDSTKDRVDWMDEEEEAFVNVDRKPSGEWTEE